MEALLYHNYKLVGLKLLDDVNLFDVFVRVKGGIFGGRKRMLNLGSFLLYKVPCPDTSGVHDSDAEEYYDLYAGEVKEGLRMLKAREYDDLPGDVFQVRKGEIVATERISKATGLSTNLSQMFTGWCSTAVEMQCTISKLWHHAVVDTAIDELFVGDKHTPPVWKPNMSKIRSACDPRGGADGAALEIWIVREKVFCEDIIFNDVHEASANASATVPLHGTSPAVEAQANHRAAVSKHTLGLHPLGFKAVRLFYNNDGELLKWRPDMGDAMPTLRHSDHEVDNASYHDQYTDYHLGGFFVEEPPSAHSTQPDVSLVPLELLDIETLATESSSPM